MALINEMEVEQTLDKYQELEVKNYLVALMRTNLPLVLLTRKGRSKTNFPVDVSRALCSISQMLLEIF